MKSRFVSSVTVELPLHKGLLSLSLCEPLSETSCKQIGVDGQQCFDDVIIMHFTRMFTPADSDASDHLSD